VKLRGYRICETGWFYKIIFDIVHLNKHDFLIHLLPLPGAISLKYTSVVTVALSDRIFCERVVNIWNRLPVDSTDFGSLHRFRNSLDAVDDTILVDAQ